MKLYKPELLSLVKVRIYSKNYPESYYLTLDESNINKVVFELKNWINSLPEKSSKTKKLTSIEMREYNCITGGIRANKSLIRQNGKSRSVSIKGYNPSELHFLLLEMLGTTNR